MDAWPYIVSKTQDNYYYIGKEIGKATNNIETGRLSKKIGDVYETLHWDKLSSKQFPVESRTNSKGEISSYQLSVDNPYDYNELAKGLCEIFDIEYDKVFIKAFSKACTGKGSEGMKIRTLHSSSLCAFLHFYNISENNPAKLMIDGDSYVFENVTFEVKNRVISAVAPSCIDIALLGYREGDQEKKVVLFLESKFLEYIRDTGRKTVVSENYRNPNKCECGSLIYNRLNECDYIVENKDKKAFYIKTSDNRMCYLDGIKQLISHYIGIYNLMKDADNLNDKKYYLQSDDKVEMDIKKAIRNPDTLILLGEVIFSKDIGKEYFIDYSKRYSNLSHLLNDITKEKTRLKVLNKLIEYDQDGFQWINNNRIRQFYYS